MNYLDGLNARQKEAVQHTDGPLLIIAGAGAGKTRVITHRILHLIQQGVAPESILAITFTNKAAGEMRDRVYALISTDGTFNQEDNFDSSTNRYTLNATRFPWLGTFHSLGVYILRENCHRLGLSKRFAIFDRGDSISAIREAIRESGLDPKNFEPGKILSAISREKGNMVRLETFLERLDRGYFQDIVGSVWEKYEAILKRERALDFDDLLLKTALLLEKEKLVREHYQRRWRYIHIDEYQDTNHVQYMVAKLLAKEHKNIAVVGDPDQNIYSWRGAAIKNILHFEKDYPSTKTVLLEENYRSTQMILTVANRIIKKNKQRKEKILFTRGVEGEKIGLFTAYDEEDEASFVARMSKCLIVDGVAPREIAVLFRANFQSRALEEAYMGTEVPYQVLGVRFFERKEVKDVISYARAAQTTFAEQNLHGQALEGLSDIRRIINVPPRGIGKVTLLKIFAGKESELPSAVREKIGVFRTLLAELKNKLQNEPLSVTLKWIVTASGLEAMLKKGGSDDEERLENIKELVTFAARYDAEPDREAAVNQFLTDAALQSDQDELKEERNAVRLMTVHASKGLEFDYVFITGLEQDLFPHSRTTFAEPAHQSGKQNLNGQARLGEDNLTEEKAEEERRLFYVALTRAKKKVFLSYAGVRTIFGSRQVTVPSEFIFDIDEEFLQAENPVENMRKTIYF